MSLLLADAQGPDGALRVDLEIVLGGKPSDLQIGFFYGTKSAQIQV